MGSPDDGFFAFERDFASSMVCIPMAVRLKLDECGIKVSLKEWIKLLPEERQRLLAEPAASPDQRGEFAAQVRQLITARLGTAPASLEVPNDPPWNRTTEVPQEIAEKAAAEGISITVDSWAALSPLQRFALLKLCRPRHKNENFRPACHEFGLIAEDR